MKPNIFYKPFKVTYVNALVKLILLSTSLTGSNHVYRSYQTMIYCNASSDIQYPKDTLSLITIVESAIRKGQTVKAIGSRHSTTDIICTEGIPISLKNIAHAQINHDATATFGAGIKLHAAMEFLESKNLSLIHVPAYGGISIGGAIGTAAHGSSLRHTASLSDQMVGLTVITGNGTLLKISGSELDTFRCHLGLLGIVIDVTLKTVALFKMTIRNEVKSDNLLFDGSIPLAATNYDMYQLWWFPHTKRVVIGTGDYVSSQTPGKAVSHHIPSVSKSLGRLYSNLIELLQRMRMTRAMHLFSSLTELSLYTDVKGKMPIFTDNGRNVVNPATGYAWRLQSSICEFNASFTCPWGGDESDSTFVEESSMAFDLSKFPGVMRMIQKVLKKHHAAFALNGIYIRFIKASPPGMAISSERNTFVVEWPSIMRKDPFETSRDSLGTYQAILQEMVTNYGGRSHWGKIGLYYTTEEILAKSNPNRQQFLAAMKTYDPQGTFLNAFGRRLLGISNTQDRDPRVKHCALQDYCICSNNNDCATFQRCDKINGFPVCMDNFKVMSSETRAVDSTFPELYNLPQVLSKIISQMKASSRHIKVREI